MNKKSNKRMIRKLNKTHKNRIIYSKNAIVACLDILGFKNRVKDDLTAEEARDDYANKYNFSKMLKECLKISFDVYKYICEPFDNLQLIVFSDTIIVVLDLKEWNKHEIRKIAENNVIFDFLNVIAMFVIVCGNDGIFLRGGIAKGDFYYDKDYFYESPMDILISNGLVRASELESQCATYARILVDKRTISQIEEKDKNLLIDDSEDDNKDNFHVLNIFKAYEGIFNFDTFLKNVDECIYKHHNDKKIRLKYLYLKKLYAFHKNISPAPQFNYTTLA